MYPEIKRTIEVLKERSEKIYETGEFTSSDLAYVMSLLAVILGAIYEEYRK